MAVISTNLAANSAVRYLNANSADQTASLSKLASGSRIVSAADDASGLAISTRISSDVTALTQAATNASHGTSILQTADGGASNISDMLQRMKALASQSASGTVTDSERTYIQAEFAQLVEEIDGIAQSTRYNGESLLDGTSDFSTGMVVVVGSDATSDTITVTIDALTSTELGVDASDISTQAGATTAIAAIDAAIDSVSSARANIGALESRFEFRSNTIATSIENLEAANSAIKDVDVAAESANLASIKVKTQAAVAAAAQANSMPQELLKLLQ
ncbi:MAG TPA: flagellin [Bosea sp. (in: a-proteobacteria)]|jgi:flagellin|uniref:flagellin n=1 Tax=Bosea sp. (in: a-proteobacteria) TaxID=1871050 RepID=UPI002DDD0D41|nr:flagellin [Bosea sp. (in: a-proteobacteria)]HEV2555700.1 flagellin [Bosea sp. (in: a-proteobacteria)]